MGSRRIGSRPRGASNRRARLAALASGVLLVASLSPAAVAPVAGGVPQVDLIGDVLMAVAEFAGEDVSIRYDGDIVRIDGRTESPIGPTNPQVDMLESQSAFMDDIDAWLRSALDCEAPMLPPGARLVCAANKRGPLSGPVYLFAQRQAAPVEELQAQVRYEFGPMMVQAGYEAAPTVADNPFSGISHAIITRVQGAAGEVLYFTYQDGQFGQFSTDARTIFLGSTVLTVVPEAVNVQRMIELWDTYSYASSDGTPANTTRDMGRGFTGGSLFAYPPQPPLLLFEEVVATPVPPTATAAPVTAPPVVVTPAPNATVSPASPTQPPAGGTSNDLFGLPPLLLILVGGIVALLGGWLLLGGRRRPAQAPGGGGDGAPLGSGGRVISAPVSDDPCPPLIEAAKRARGACEAALRRAAEAADKAIAASKALQEAMAELERARKAREAAEEELARRSQEPDRSSWMESGGQREDSYDLKLKADARAAANARYKEHGSKEQWQQDLQHIDTPEGLDELRRNDTEGREKWRREAQEALDAAKAAEASAEAAHARAQAAYDAANTAANAAKKAADEACEAAARAEATAAECLGHDTKKEGVPIPPGGGRGGGEGGGPPGPGGGAGGGGSLGPGGGPGSGGPGGGDKPTAGGDPPPTPGGGGGGGETPPPTRPRGNECHDGDEEWRPEGARETFLIPVPGAKIKIDISPEMKSFTEWYDGWNNVNDAGQLDTDAGEGIPGGRFARTDSSRWSQVFDKIGRKAMEFECDITLPLQEVTAHCERRYACENGYWKRTGQTRDVESEPVPKPRLFHWESPATTLNEIVPWCGTAVTAWKAAEDARDRLASFGGKCKVP